MMTQAEIQAQIRHEDKDLHETKIYFDLVDLDEQHDHEASNLIIKERDSQIRELQTNLEISKFFISYYEQENEQLKTKQAILEIQLLKAKREENKEKAFLDEAYEKYVETNEV